MNSIKILLLVVCLLFIPLVSADFVDNFGGSSVNTSLWSVESRSAGVYGNITVADGEAHFDPGNTTASENLRTNGSYKTVSVLYKGVSSPSYGYGTISIANNGTGETVLVGLSNTANWWQTCFKNGYTVEFGTTEMKLNKMVDGTATQLDNTNNIPSAYRNYSLFINESGVHATINGTVELTSPDSTYTDGGDILISQGSAFSGDNFREGYYSQAIGILSEAAPSAPTFTYTSENTSSYEYETDMFTANASDTVNVSWVVNGNELQTNISVSTFSYSNSSALNGSAYNITAIITNTEGSAQYEWEQLKLLNEFDLYINFENFTYVNFTVTNYTAGMFESGYSPFGFEWDGRNGTSGNNSTMYYNNNMTVITWNSTYVDGNVTLTPTFLLPENGTYLVIETVIEDTTIETFIVPVAAFTAVVFAGAAVVSRRVRRGFGKFISRLRRR